MVSPGAGGCTPHTVLPTQAKAAMLLDVNPSRMSDLVRDVREIR